MGIAFLERELTNRKFKSPNHQDGTVYLTSHRVCYVDDVKPMLYSIGVDLEQIDKIETSVTLPEITCVDIRLDSLNHHRK